MWETTPLERGTLGGCALLLLKCVTLENPPHHSWLQLTALDNDLPAPVYPQGVPTEDWKYWDSPCESGILVAVSNQNSHSVLYSSKQPIHIQFSL